MSRCSGGGSMPRCRYGAMSSSNCMVPRRSSRAARISGVTGDSARPEASTAISKVTLVERQQFVDSARCAVAQLIVGGQRGLHVEVEQQYAQSRVRGEPAQIGGGGGLAHTAFGRDDGYNLHGGSPCWVGEARQARSLRRSAIHCSISTESQPTARTPRRMALGNLPSFIRL